MFDFGYKPFPHDDSQYFRNTQTYDIYIPVGDVAAYRAYPQYQWMYNKLQLTNEQGIYAFPDGDRTPPFPVFRKPIYNLYGMGAGAEMISNKAQYNKNYKPGYFLMPYLEGKHYSTDLVIVQGRIMWMETMLCHTSNKSFYSFEIVTPDISTIHVLCNWISAYFKEYSGVVNIETINNVIIECHIRMSTQFIDLYGEGWLDAVVSVYAENTWGFTKKNKNKGYSLVLRVHELGSYKFNESAIREARCMCSSIQIFLEPGGYEIMSEKDADDGHTYRIAVINGFKQEDCEEALRILSCGLIKVNYHGAKDSVA
jgi:hypothetical protein